MQFFITVLHVMLCFALILIILLQPGKDGSAVFGGGGGNQGYGPRGQANFLGRATTVVAALFMFTSITLAFYGSRRAQQGSSVPDNIDRLQQEEQSSGAAIDAAPQPEPTPEVAPPAEVPMPTMDEHEAGSDDPSTGDDADQADIGEASGSDGPAPNPPAE